MRKSALLVLSLLPACLQAQATAPVAQSLILTHVTVIDSTGAPAKPDMTVVITGDRITGLGPSGQVAIPRDAQVIAASGKFLIPGLWDMHAHVAINPAMKDSRMALLIANGITGVRDMGGLLDSINQWRREIATGALLGPRIVAAGPILDGAGSRFGVGSRSSSDLGANFYTIVASPAEGRAAVDEVQKEGADFVKVYSMLSRDVYFAIADEAHKRGIPFAGHLPLPVTVAQASDAGQKSIEHMFGMVLAVSSREAELMQQFVQKKPSEELSAWRTFELLEANSIESHSQTRATELYQRLIRNGTWECPTLVVLRGSAFLDDPSIDDPNDPRLKYMSPTTRQHWKPGRDSFPAPTAEESTAERRLYFKRMEMVGVMQRAGVGILAGSDMGNPYVFPGFSLHEELELMVKAGLTPMQALQTATLNAARYLGKERDLGTISVGKLADLVLLDANPLSGIRNTRKIEAVIVAGKLVDKVQREAMLAHVAAVYRGN